MDFCRANCSHTVIVIPPISFFVPGIPKPAGSKRGFFIAKIKRVVIVDACAKSRDWKTDVQYAARDFYSGPLLDVPLKVRLDFIVARPKGHFGSGKNSKVLKGSASAFPAVMPDVLKLARAVEDALTGIVWEDDALIVHETITKNYGEHPGVMIHVSEMAE